MRPATRGCAPEPRPKERDHSSHPKSAPTPPFCPRVRHHFPVPQDHPPSKPTLPGVGKDRCQLPALGVPESGVPVLLGEAPRVGFSARMSWQVPKASPGQAHTSESQGQAPGGQSTWAAVGWPARQYLQQHTPHVGLHVLGTKLAQQELCRQPLGHEVGHPVAIVAVEDPIQEAVVLTPGRERGRR